MPTRSPSKRRNEPALQLRVTLDRVVPLVWRRLLVPGSVRLSKLSDILQAAMGWNNSHLHSFQIGDSTYGMWADDYPEDEINETTVSVVVALGDEERFAYEYDFGDSWDHEIVVESFMTSQPGLRFAVCLDGQNACPPDDSGGPYGYAHLLEVLNDPTDEEYPDLMAWAGGPIDPSAFDLVAVNAALQRLA